MGGLTYQIIGAHPGLKTNMSDQHGHILKPGSVVDICNKMLRTFEFALKKRKQTRLFDDYPLKSKFLVSVCVFSDLYDFNEDH
ncbi:hypothetical protein DBR43_24695 [Pedobacter sp. KBW06]|nr:hypothetical protein DBR43_24695 [Pedobacter sp. KBW06]